MEITEEDDDPDVQESESPDIYRLAALKCQEIYGTTKALHMGETIECPKCSGVQDISNNGAANYSAEGLEAPTCSIVSGRTRESNPVDEKPHLLFTKCHELFGQIRTSNPLQELATQHCKCLQETFDDKPLFTQICAAKAKDVDIKLEKLKQNEEASKKSIETGETSQQNSSTDEPSTHDGSKPSQSKSSTCQKGNEILIQFLNTVPTNKQDEEEKHTAEDIVRFVASKLKDIFGKKRGKTVYEQADIFCNEIHSCKEGCDKPKFQEIHRSMGNLNVVELAIPENQEAQVEDAEHKDQVIEKPQFQEVHRTLGQDLNVVEMTVQNGKENEESSSQESEEDQPYMLTFQKLFGGYTEDDTIRKAVEKCQEIQKTTGDRISVEELLTAICRHAQYRGEDKNAADKIAQIVIAKCQELLLQPKQMSVTAKTKAVQEIDSKQETKAIQEIVDSKQETKTVQETKPVQETKAVQEIVDRKQATTSNSDSQQNVAAPDGSVTADSAQKAEEHQEECYTIYEEAAKKCQEIYISSKIPYSDADTEKQMTGPRRGTMLLELPASLNVTNGETDSKSSVDQEIDKNEDNEKREKLETNLSAQHKLGSSPESSKEMVTQEDRKKENVLPEDRKKENILPEDLAEFVISVCKEMFERKSSELKKEDDKEKEISKEDDKEKEKSKEKEKPKEMHRVSNDIKKAEEIIHQEKLSVPATTHSTHEVHPTEVSSRDKTDEMKVKSLREAEREFRTVKKREAVDPSISPINNPKLTEKPKPSNDNLLRSSSFIEKPQRQEEEDDFTSKMQNIVEKLEKIDTSTDPNENCQTMLQLLADCLMELTTMKNIDSEKTDSECQKSENKLMQTTQADDQCNSQKLNESKKESSHADIAKRQDNCQISVQKKGSECNKPVTLEIRGKKPVLLQIQSSKIAKVKDVTCSTSKDEEEKNLNVYEEAILKCQDLFDVDSQKKQSNHEFPECQAEKKQELEEEKNDPSLKQKNSKYLEIHGPLGDKLIVVEVAPKKCHDDSSAEDKPIENLKMMGIEAPISNEMKDSEEHVHTAEEIAWYFITKCKEILGIPGEKEIVSDRCEKCPKIFRRKERLSVEELCEDFPVEEKGSFHCKHIDNIELRHTAEEIVQNIISKCQEIFGAKKNQSNANEDYEKFQVVLGTFGENVETQEIVSAIFGETDDDEKKRVAQEMVQNVVLKCQEIMESSTDEENSETKQEPGSKCYEADADLKGPFSVYEEAILKCRELYAKMDTTYSTLVQEKMDSNKVNQQAESDVQPPMVLSLPLINLEEKGGKSGTVKLEDRQSSEIIKDIISSVVKENQERAGVLHLAEPQDLTSCETSSEKEAAEKTEGASPEPSEEKRTAEDIARYFVSKCKEVLKKAHDKKSDSEEEVKFTVICGPIEDKLTVEERAAKKCKELFGPEEKHTAEDIAQYFITKCKDIIAKMGESHKGKETEEEEKRGEGNEGNECKLEKIMHSELQRRAPETENGFQSQMAIQKHQEKLRSAKVNQKAINLTVAPEEQKTVYGKAAIKCQEIYNSSTVNDAVEDTDCPPFQKAYKYFRGNRSLKGIMQTVQCPENLTGIDFREEAARLQRTNNSKENLPECQEPENKTITNGGSFLEEKNNILKINERRNNVEDVGILKCQDIQEIMKEVKSVKDLAKFFLSLHQEILSIDKTHSGDIAVQKSTELLKKLGDSISITDVSSLMTEDKPRSSADSAEDKMKQNNGKMEDPSVSIDEKSNLNVLSSETQKSDLDFTRKWKEIFDMGRKVEAARERREATQFQEKRKTIPTWQEILDNSKDEEKDQCFTDSNSSMSLTKENMTPNWMEDISKAAENIAAACNNKGDVSNQTLGPSSIDASIPVWRMVLDSNSNECTRNGKPLQENNEDNQQVEQKSIPQKQDDVQNVESKNKTETSESNKVKSEAQNKELDEIMIQKWLEIAFEKCQEILEKSRENAKKDQKMDETVSKNQSPPFKSIPTWNDILNEVEQNRATEESAKRRTSRDEVNCRPVIPTWQDILNNVDCGCTKEGSGSTGWQNTKDSNNNINVSAPEHGSTVRRDTEELGRNGTSISEVKGKIPSWQQILNNPDCGCCKVGSNFQDSKGKYQTTKELGDKEMRDVQRELERLRALPIWQEILNRIDEEEKENRKYRLCGIWKEILDDAECNENIGPNCFVNNDNMRRNRLIKELAQTFFSKFQDVLGNMKKTRYDESENSCLDTMWDTEVPVYQERDGKNDIKNQEVNESSKQTYNEVSKIRRNELMSNRKLQDDKLLEEIDNNDDYDDCDFEECYDNDRILNTENDRILNEDEWQLEKTATGRDEKDKDDETCKVCRDDPSSSVEKVKEKGENNEDTLLNACKVKSIHRTKNPEYTGMMKREVEREKSLRENIEREREEEAILREAGMLAVNEAPKTATKTDASVTDRKSEVAECVRNEMVIRNMEIEEALIEVVACPRFEELIIGEIEREEVRKQASCPISKDRKEATKKTDRKTDIKSCGADETLEGIFAAPKLEKIIAREIEKIEKKKTEEKATNEESKETSN